MKSLADFLLFNAGWFVAVDAAADGRVWLGVPVFLIVVAVHLAWLTPVGERRAELTYAIALGAFGIVADTGLHVLGVTSYPTSTAAWPYLVPPPWIGALWFGFAVMGRHSLAWLAGRPLLGAALGAVGGPISYFAGVRLGAVAVESSAWLTYGGLALEYALVTPLLVAAAPARQNRPAIEPA